MAGVMYDSMNTAGIRRLLAAVDGWSLSAEPLEFHAVVDLAHELIKVAEDGAQTHMGMLTLPPRPTVAERDHQPRQTAWKALAKHLDTDSMGMASLFARARVVLFTQSLGRFQRREWLIRPPTAHDGGLLFRDWLEVVRTLAALDESLAMNGLSEADAEEFTSLDETVRGLAWPLMSDDLLIKDLRTLLPLLHAAAWVQARSIQSVIAILPHPAQLLLRPGVRQLQAHTKLNGAHIVVQDLVKEALAGHEVPLIKREALVAGRWVRHPDLGHAFPLLLQLACDRDPPVCLLMETSVGQDLWQQHVRPLLVAVLHDYNASC